MNERYWQNERKDASSVAVQRHLAWSHQIPRSRDHSPLETSLDLQAGRSEFEFGSRAAFQKRLLDKQVRIGPLKYKLHKDEYL
jgi:hypothetical protein